MNQLTNIEGKITEILELMHKVGRSYCLAVIRVRKLNAVKLAGLLGIQPYQARELLGKAQWSGNDIERVAKALGLSTQQAYGQAAIPELPAAAVKAPQLSQDVRGAETVKIDQDNGPL